MKDDKKRWSIEQNLNCSRELSGKSNIQYSDLNESSTLAKSQYDSFE